MARKQFKSQKKKKEERKIRKKEQENIKKNCLRQLLANYIFHILHILRSIICPISPYKLFPIHSVLLL